MDIKNKASNKPVERLKYSKGTKPSPKSRKCPKCGSMDVREDAGGVDPVTAQSRVNSYILALPLMRSFERRFRFRSTASSIVILLGYYGDLSASKLMMLHYGVRAGGNMRTVFKSLNILRDCGLVYNKAGKWGLTTKGLYELGLVDQAENF